MKRLTVSVSQTQQLLSELPPATSSILSFFEPNVHKDSILCGTNLSFQPCTAHFPSPPHLSKSFPFGHEFIDLIGDIKVLEHRFDMD